MSSARDFIEESRRQQRDSIVIGWKDLLRAHCHKLNRGGSIQLTIPGDFNRDAVDESVAILNNEGWRAALVSGGNRVEISLAPRTPSRWFSPRRWLSALWSLH